MADHLYPAQAKRQSIDIPVLNSLWSSYIYDISGVTGYVGVSQEKSAVSTVATITLSGASSISQDKATLVAIAVLSLSGSVLTSQDKPTIASLGNLLSTGSISISQDKATFNADGSVVFSDITGVVIVDQKKASIVATGSVFEDFIADEVELTCYVTLHIEGYSDVGIEVGVQSGIQIAIEADSEVGVLFTQYSDITTEIEA